MKTHDIGCACGICRMERLVAAKDARIAELVGIARLATERGQRAEKAEAEVARLSGLIAEVMAMIDGALNVPKGEAKN